MDRAEDRRRRRVVAVTLALLAVLSSSAASHAATADRPGRIERVRYEADDRSTRVIILLSRPIPFYVRLMNGEAARKSERRMVLDFSNATLGPGATSPVGVENGILQQIRTGQFNARTARVVLDLASVTKHTIDAFEDPPRIVIDISGTPTTSTPDAAIASAPAPAPAPAPVPEPPEARRGPPSEAGALASQPAAPAPPSAEPTRAPAPPDNDKAVRASTADASTEPRGEPAPVPAASPKRTETASNRATAGSEPLPGRPANRPWRIVLDPGHGGADPGAQGVDGLLEKDVVLAIAQRLKRRLEESSNAKVLLTRETDATRTLAERTAFANANSADLFVSIHANADRSGDLQGIETYTLNNSNDRATMRLAKMENGPAVRVGRGDLSFILSDMVQSGKEEESNALAERLHSRVLARLRSRYTDIHNLGVKKGPFYVLVGAYMPCVLVETSFLSHPIEGKRLGTTAYQHDIAEGLFLGITDFLGDARLAKTL
jgi:N-acetylmuramoyl-L-alanine amidase